MTTSSSTCSGKPWKSHKSFPNFESADAERKLLVSKGLETRIRRRVSGSFDVKVRSPQVGEVSLTKNKKKTRKNKQKRG